MKNDGCATEQPHEQNAEPIAYERELPLPPPTPHPAEGTRLRRPASAAEVPIIGGEVGPPAESAPVFDDDLPADLEFEGDDQEPEEDDDEPAPFQTPIPEPPRSVRHGRYEPLETVPVRRPMPSIYRRHRLLSFWYVPVSILIGAVVAVGVVLGADYLGGDDGEGGSPSNPLPTTTPAPSSPEATTPPSDQTVTVVPSATPDAPRATATTAAEPTVTALVGDFLFGPDDRVIVVGTGDCLRVRDAPTTSGREISCLGDGVQATIIEGPAEANGFRWWLVRAGGVAEGWVAEDYLGRAP